MEVKTMQRTSILRGTVNKEYGKTIAEAINEKLDKNPEFELVQTTVLESSDVFCTLLCVFEKSWSIYLYWNLFQPQNLLIYRPFLCFAAALNTFITALVSLHLGFPKMQLALTYLKMLLAPVSKKAS